MWSGKLTTSTWPHWVDWAIKPQHNLYNLLAESLPWLVLVYTTCLCNSCQVFRVNKISSFYNTDYCNAEYYITLLCKSLAQVLTSLYGLDPSLPKVLMYLSCMKFCIQGWLGGAKVSFILRHQGVQLILAYSWARPAILVAGKGSGGCFYFFFFFTFIPVPLSFLSLSFISSTISSISFLPFSGRRHKMTHKGWHVVKPQLNQKFCIQSGNLNFCFLLAFPLT